MYSLCKRFTFLSLIFCITFNYAQAPDTLWTKTYGGSAADAAYSVQQTNDSGYIVAGYTSSFGAGAFDIYVIKTDVNGDTMWTKTYGGVDWDYGWAVKQTTDSGYVILGWTNSFGAGGFDTYLIKTDIDGDFVWAKTYGGTGSDLGNTVQQTYDGGYVIAGGSGLNVFLIKTDDSGDTIWSKIYGGGGAETAKSVQQTNDSGYIVAGYTSSFGAGAFDIYVIKTDVNGDTMWTRAYGGADSDYGYSIQVCSDGGYIIVGETYSFGAGDADVWFLKINSSGDTLWTKTYGGSYGDYGYDVKEIAGHGYIIVGCSYSDLYLIRTNNTGDMLWTRKYGGPNFDSGRSIYQITNYGYIVAGYTESFGAGDNDVWLLKIESDTFGIKEQKIIPKEESYHGATILTGSLLLPEGKKCKVYDITGRAVLPDKIRPGIYFIETDNKIVQKIVKVR